MLCTKCRSSNTYVEVEQEIIVAFICNDCGEECFDESGLYDYHSAHAIEHKVSKEEFIRALNKLVEVNDPEDDYTTYIIDEYCDQNNIKFDNYNEVTINFLGKTIPKREVDECEDGPFGGAFRDEKDYVTWRNGSGLVDSWY